MQTYGEDIEGKRMSKEDKKRVEKLTDELIEIYEELKDGELQNENYNSVIFAGHFIKKFKEKNIKIEDITADLIDELKDKRNYPLWHILSCVNSVYEFYDPELSDKYIVVCYVDYDEIAYCKAKIIGDIDELDLGRKNLEPDDIGEIVDLDTDDFIASEDLTEYQGRNKVLKAMNTIRKEFPGGTQFVMVNL